VVFDGDSKFTSLLLSNSASVNQPLAAIYGLKGVTGTTMTQAMLDPGQRAGLLTRAGFLAVAAATDGSNPVQRGRKVFERLLCGGLPPPPNVVPQPKPASAGGTTRQRFEEHDRNPCTGACHAVMDPIGYGFEHYDGVGKFRAMDNGGVVDSTGSIELDGVKKPFNDARELSQMLAGSTEVARCFATQWLRFAFKRTDTDADRASIDAITTAFGKANSIKDLLVGVASSRSFRYRTPANGEMLQ
jgi:hypothetical protein